MGAAVGSSNNASDVGRGAGSRAARCESHHQRLTCACGCGDIGCHTPKRALETRDSNRHLSPPWKRPCPPLSPSLLISEMSSVDNRKRVKAGCMCWVQTFPRMIHSVGVRMPSPGEQQRGSPCSRVADVQVRRPCQRAEKIRVSFSGVWKSFLLEVEPLQGFPHPQNESKIILDGSCGIGHCN